MFSCWLLSLLRVRPFLLAGTIALALAASSAAVPPAFPLHVSADDRRLEDAMGRGVLINGDSAWSLMVELDAAEVATYLEDRRQRGFNTILVNLIEIGFGGPANQNGDLPFTPLDDFTAPNEEYFAFADYVIDLAASKGMLVLLAPAYLGSGCGSQGWCDILLEQTEAAMLDYGRYLGSRYASRDNILWVHGGDTSASSHGVDDHVNAIVQGIEEEAPAHLHTAHCSRNASGIDCYDEPWLDVNTTYSACEDSLEAIQGDYARVPTQVFFYIEGKYENEGVQLECLMDQNAWSVIAGAGGHVFGNRPIWLFDTGWPAALSSPGSQAMDHMSDLFRSRAWFRFEPDLTHTVLTGGAGSDGAAARTSDGETVMVYVPSARTVTVNLNSLSGSQAHGWWFNPATGAVTDLGVFTSSGSSNFASPGIRMLVIDDVASGLAAPGSTVYQQPASVPGPAILPLAIAAATMAALGVAAVRRRR